MHFAILSSRGCFVQRLTDDWVYGPKYLTEAAQLTDPVERFRKVVCFAFASVHIGIGQVATSNMRAILEPN